MNDNEKTLNNGKLTEDKADRLAAYEKAGLSPKEIERLKADYYRLYTLLNDIGVTLGV